METNKYYNNIERFDYNYRNMTELNKPVEVEDTVSLAPSDDPEAEFRTIIKYGNKSEVNANIWRLIFEYS